MNSEDVANIVSALPVCNTRTADTSILVKLSPEMGGALGTSKRRLINVLGTVIDAIADKLFIEIIDITQVDEDTATAIKKQIQSIQRKLLRTVVRDGRAYVLVTDTLQIIPAFNGHDGAAYVHDELTGDVLYAVNTYTVAKSIANKEKELRYLDVYYPDRVEHFIFDDEWQSREPTDYTDKDNAPLGLPLIEYNIGDSDITDALQLRDDINDAILDLLATSRTMGFPQRYLKGVADATYLLDGYNQPLRDGLGNKVQIRYNPTPGNIHILQGKDSELGQLPPAESSTAVIDKLLDLLSYVTTVPVFYFKGSDFPAGVALIQAEGRLNSKVEAHQDELTPALEQTIRHMLQRSNAFSDTRFDTTTPVVIAWAAPQVYTVDLQIDMTESSVKNATLLYNAGVLSIEDTLRLSFPEKTDDEIAAMVQRTKNEKALPDL